MCLGYMQNAIYIGMIPEPSLIITAGSYVQDRRMNTFFSLSQHWKNYDVFARQKMSTFKSSRPAVVELAAKYKELVTQLELDTSSNPPKSAEEHQHAEKNLFTEMCEICLWGNATDLSLLTSLTYEDIQKLQGSDARKAAEKNIIANELPAAYTILQAAKQMSPKTDRRVDIVLDNAGFELFVDLILAGYLLTTQLATTIVLHPKSIPWFVSDVLPADFGALLNALADPQYFFSTPSDDEKHAGKTPQPLSEKEVDELSFLFRQWSSFHQEGQLVIRPNRFWTEAGSYWRLPRTEPRLYEDLKESELVILKGDLNYRKLTGDVFTPSSLSPSLILTLTPLPGNVATKYTLPNRSRSLRSQLKHPHSRSQDLQSGCGGGVGRRRGREAEKGR